MQYTREPVYGPELMAARALLFHQSANRTDSVIDAYRLPSVEALLVFFFETLVCNYGKVTTLVVTSVLRYMLFTSRHFLTHADQLAPCVCVTKRGSSNCVLSILHTHRRLCRYSVAQSLAGMQHWCVVRLVASEAPEASAVFALSHP